MVLDDCACTAIVSFSPTSIAAPGSLAESAVTSCPLTAAVQGPVIDATAGAATGIVSVGSCDGAIREAIDVLKRRGIGVDYMRVRSFPFSEDVERFLAAHERLFVVEQNRDAQLRSLLTLETAVEKSKLRSLLHYSGLPISSSFIVEGVLAELEPRQLATAQGATGGRSG